MSWHFSRALVEEFLEATCLDGGPSALWNSIPSAPDDLCSDKMKGIFHHSPFGTMYVPSTDAPGGALLMLYQAASRAKTSVLPVREVGLMESDPGFGSKWSGLLAKYARDSSSLKTAQISLITGLHESYLHLPRWGSMRNGELSALPIPEHPTCGKDAGLLPTPMASDNRDRGNTNNPSIKRRMSIGKQIGLSMLFERATCPSCAEAMMGWPVGWTDSQPLETARFQQWRLQHGGF